MKSSCPARAGTESTTSHFCFLLSPIALCFNLGLQIPADIRRPSASRKLSIYYQYYADYDGNVILSFAGIFASGLQFQLNCCYCAKGGHQFESVVQYDMSHYCLCVCILRHSALQKPKPFTCSKQYEVRT